LRNFGSFGNFGVDLPNDCGLGGKPFAVSGFEVDGDVGNNACKRARMCCWPVKKKTSRQMYVTASMTAWSNLVASTETPASLSQHEVVWAFGADTCRSKTTTTGSKGRGYPLPRLKRNKK
jgi:hypothetical protein